MNFNLSLARKISVSAFMVLGIAAHVAVAAPISPFDVAHDKNGVAYVKGEVLVKTRSPAALERLLAKASLQESLQVLSNRKAIQSDASGSWYKVKSEASLESLLATLGKREANDGVSTIEPNYVYYTNFGPSPKPPAPAPLPDLQPEPQLPDSPLADPRMNELYGLEKIQAAAAWKLTRGSKKVVIANIDTGVDYNHPDLSNNLWRNKAEIPNNKIDDDNNGSVDDLIGYNFRDGVAMPYDDNSHGSHTIGTIAATGGNGVGVSGVMQVASIMALRFLGGYDGSGTTEDAISCIDYATKNGASIMSNSWGGGGKSTALEDSIKRANAKGVLFVAAAGNESSNNDNKATYPASYNVPNILVVAATDQNDSMASFSNFGLKSVHVAAPGVKILSTFPKNSYGAISGTSMATPHVAGLAGLLKAVYPQLKAPELKALIMESVDAIDGLKSKVVTGGRINALKALQLAEQRYGAPVIEQ